MTVTEVIQKSADYLRKRGVESPRLQAELLLAHVLKLPRLKLYLDFERLLDEHELDVLRQLVRRRGEREPLQHILGGTSFCGLEMKVNRHVLVPRPETELLAERADAFLATLDSRPSRVLDLGTGSGCLAIYLAARHPKARVMAVDISTEALAVARENAAAHHATDQIEFMQGDLFQPLAAGTAFDLIVSNPPYIPSSEIATLQPEVREFDPRAALDGGADGLDISRRLAAEAGAFLRPAGKLMIEFGDDQAAELREIFLAHKWVVESVDADYNQRQRILMARPVRQ